MSRLFSTLIAAITLGVFCTCDCAIGQDPFADEPSTPSRDSGSVESTTKSETGRVELDTLPANIRLIVQSVRNSNPTSPAQLAGAIQTMMDLEEYSEAKFYLKQLSALNLDAQGMFQLNQSMGSAFFLRLIQSQQMAPQGGEFANKALRDAKKTATDPQRIDQLIQKLSDDNDAIRSGAARELVRLGEPAIAQMINAFTDPGKADQYDGIRAALQVSGEVGLNPLSAGALADSEQVQLECVIALSKIRRPESYDAIVAAFYSGDSSSRVKTAASSAFLNEYGYFPDVPRASASWFKRANDLLDDESAAGARRLGFASPPTTVWRWDAAAKSLAQYRLSSIAARRIQAADKAEILAEINPNNSELHQFNILTHLESIKHLSGASAEINTEAFRKKFYSSDANRVNEALKTAMDRDLVAAAIGCCEVLGDFGDPTVLYSGSHRTSPLVDAILYGDRHLRYAALNAIVKLDPSTNFAGSSYVTECAVYMADFADRPGVLVGNAQEDLARSIAARLGPIGFNGSTAQNGRDFYRMATHDANLEFLMMSDTFHRPDYAELVQQLRQDWRTARTPIAILYRSQNASRAKRVARDDDLTVAIPLTLNTELIALQVEQLIQANQGWAVTLDHRRLHSELATNWLAKVANDQQRYSFVDLGAHENQLARMIFTPGSEDAAIAILSSMGTAQSQRVLVNFASETGMTIPLRQQASDGFKKSVSRNGVLLTRSEILKQYDRYNSSEGDSADSQKVFGSLLDVIEENARANQ